MFFRTEIPGLHLCSSNKVTNLLLTQHGEEIFSLDTADIKREYDFVLVDTDPAYVPFESLDLFTFSLLTEAQVLIPVRAHIMSLGGVKSTLEDLGEVDQSTGDISLLGAFLTVFYSDRKSSSMMIDELNRLLPGKVLETVIREDSVVAELGIYSQSQLVKLKSRGFADYSRLADEVLHLLGNEGKTEEIPNAVNAQL